MKLYLFRQAAYEKLISDLENNKLKYKENEPWVDDYFRSLDMMNYSFVTDIEVPDFTLIEGGYETDLENCKVFYDAFKNVLNPVLAADMRLWGRLTHVDCYKYMRSRWKPEEAQNFESNIRNRYFSDRAAYVRNGIARLYWIPYMTYDDTEENPYLYTEFALSKQDIITFSLERDLGRARGLIRGNLKALMESGSNMSRLDIREFYVRIDQVGGVELLDALSKEDAYQISKNIIKKILSLPKCENGRTVVIRNIKTGRILKFVVKNGKFTVGDTVFNTTNRVSDYRSGMRLEINKEMSQILSIE